MATTSRVGLKLRSRIKYCEIKHEGYIENMRKMLKDFLIKSDVEYLIDQGDRDYIGRPDEGEVHIAQNIETFISKAKEDNIEFLYLFQDNKWYVNQLNTLDWEQLLEEIEEEN